MNWEKFKRYQQAFLKDDWINKIPATELYQLKHRVDLIVKDKIIFDGPLDMEACDTVYPIDYSDTPNGDPEWVYMLARHGFLVDLTLAYAYYKDDSYLEAWKKQLFNFIHTIDESYSLSWREIDTGIRLTNWIKSLTYLDVESVLSENEQLNLKMAMKKHVIYLREHFIDKYILSNWGVLAITGILACDLLFDDIVPSATKFWAWRMFETQLHLQFDNEGIHWEQSPLYHHEVLMSSAYIWQISQRIAEAVPFDCEPILNKAATASYYYANSQDKLNGLHDSDCVDFKEIYDSYRYIGLLNDKRPERVSAQNYLGPALNNVVSFMVYPSVFEGKHSGFSAYKKEDITISVWNGLHGSSHAHAANGHLTVSYKDVDILTSTGRMTYLDNNWRRYLKSQEAHNTVCVIDYPASDISGTWSYRRLADPLFLNVIETNDSVIWELAWQGSFEEDEAHYTIKRTLVYVKSFKTIVVFDAYIGRSGEQLEWHYHLSEETDVVQFENERLSINVLDKMIHIFANDSIQLKPTGYSPIYNQIAPIQQVTIEKVSQPKTATITVISLDESVIYKEVFAYQNNITEPTNYVKGVQLTQSDASIELYFLVSDVEKGDKLFFTDSQQAFYGKLCAVQSGIFERWL